MGGGETEEEGREGGRGVRCLQCWVHDRGPLRTRRPGFPAGEVCAGPRGWREGPEPGRRTLQVGAGPQRLGGEPGREEEESRGRSPA